jgi:hypothetical protein
MADFCSACSKTLFGKDYGDLAGLIKEEECKQGWVVGVLCEGCGPTHVDHKGVCQGGCLYHDKPGHIHNPKYPLYPPGHEPKEGDPTE